MRLASIKSGKTGTILLGALLAAALLAGSCSMPLTKKQSKLEQHRKFFYMLPSKQHHEFQTYHIERQFDIYIVAMTMRQPPDTAFATILAKRKARAVPFLLKKLRQENYPPYGTARNMTDEIKEKLIFIFRMMSRYGYYNVKGDEVAVEAIRGAIENMRNAHYRQLSMAYLDEILGAN
jgi:hypothetical protein